MKTTLLLIGFAVSGCTCESGSREALESAGYTDVQFQGHGFFACGNDDASATKFTAKNPAGKETSGVVCCGVLKGCTIRH